MKSSRIPNFYKLSPSERLEIVKDFAELSNGDVRALTNTGSIPIEQADRMIENVIGIMPVTLGIAINFLINGRDYLIPMAIEEPSVVAAASNAAKMVRKNGGFYTQSTDAIMIGQIQVLKVKDPSRARFDVLSSKEKIIELANIQDPPLIASGGGARDLDVKILGGRSKPMMVVNLYVDCRDAMGANIVNTMCEAITPEIERITGGDVLLRIISNLAIKRLVRAKAVLTEDSLGGTEVVDGIVAAYEFAASDIFRCVTHNKGIMNGISAVALATGNDTRALEAGAHAYAAFEGRYSPLSTWEKDERRHLVGTLEMPMAVGIIGGVASIHPIAKISKKILKVKTAGELGEVMAAVGLAQNLAALRALATVGIQKGHMKLHARNIAAMAGAKGDDIDRVAQILVREGKIRIDRAKEILEERS